jgi:signal peptidase II
MFVAVVAVDQLTKSLVLASIDDTERVRVVGPLSLVRRFNTGMAFSQGDGSRWTAWIVSAVMIALFIWVFRTVRRPDSSLLMATLLGAIAGGGAGNQIDRLFRGQAWNKGAVVDFLDVGFWPVFNVGDMALSVGCVVLAVLSFFRPRMLQSPIVHGDVSPLASPMESPDPEYSIGGSFENHKQNETNADA